MKIDIISKIKRRNIRSNNMKYNSASMSRESDPAIVRISVSRMEEKLDGFIKFLNQDKKRLLDLVKFKYAYLKYMMEKSNKGVGYESNRR